MKSKVYQNRASPTIFKEEESMSVAEDSIQSNNNRETRKSLLPAEENGAKHEHQWTNSKYQDSTLKEFSRSSYVVGSLGIFLRTLFLDVPLFAFFVLLMAVTSLRRIETDYLWPQLKLMHFSADERPTGITYYERILGGEDVTATEAEEILVKPNMKADDVVDMMLHHGATIIPNLLSAETARAVRDFIIQQNHIDDSMITVLNGKNRWSFGIRVDQHPSIPKALKEILNNPLLSESLEKLVGKDAAVIEFTGITSGYGAEAQVWHQDVVPTDGNAAKYARHFIPSYSLFIPVQNTTAEMGATGICPGTHILGVQGPFHYCHDKGFQASGRDNNWPAGYGALVNQQTAHQGTAHVDPDAGDRVLFILTFAPRPRFGNKEVETRLIGLGGSYSLHWTQWGHTLQDFQNPERHMRQPWRTLKSIGLYKDSSSRWGWDFITQVSGRMANKEYSEDLQDAVAEGRIPYLPTVFYSRLDRDEHGPHEYAHFFSKSLTKMILTAKVLYGISACAYLVYIVSKRKQNTRRLAKTFARLALMHAIILLSFKMALERAHNTSWARNVRLGKMYNIPKVWSGDPDQPGTLPNVADVLVVSHMKSEYFGSYSRSLDARHPGNKEWNLLVGSYARGYSSLSVVLQRQLRSGIAAWWGQRGGRVLVKNSAGNWSPLGPTQIDWYVHKELKSCENVVIARVLEELEYLRNEAKFGYWRGESIHQRNTLDFLQQLERSIIDDSTLQPKTFRKTVASISLSGASLRPGQLFSIPDARLTAFPFRHAPKRSPVPQPPSIREPFEGAWAREGDHVEITFEESLRGYWQEWYRGHLILASADRMEWDVKYEDGDESSVCPECVKKLMPYFVGEEISCREGEIYSSCRVIEIHENGMHDVEFLEGGRSETVSTADIRRLKAAVDEDGNEMPLDSSEWEIGARIRALFPGYGDEYFSGSVTGIRRDGTFSIQYDDGDYLASVPSDNIIAE